MTPLRIGHGYDIHRLVPGRPLVLGGVLIPSPVGLDGHSDADCATHALCDALLGALAMPDIGQRYRNTDPRWAGMDSQFFLRDVTASLRAAGWAPVNVDISIQAERPKLAPHIPAMRARLGESLGLPPDAVGIKATTNEGQDAIGRGEAIAAHAVVLIARAA